MTTPEHRSGFVAICGRPNVGKSTLLNALIGEPVAVATPFPQTTRERLLGIWTEDAFQAVLVDTPGIHRARSALNEYMVRQAVRAARDVEVVLLLDEAPMLRDLPTAQAWQPGEVALQALQMMAELGHPIVLVLTKVDRLYDRALLLPVLEKWAEHHAFAAMVPTAALEGEGLDALRAEVLKRLPIGPQLYPPDDLSDRGMRWHAAELVRAELFEHLDQELPYSCAVRIDRYEHRNDRERVVATIFVERESQKGMVIGKGGKVVGAIRAGAQARIERLAGRPCELHLQIDVAPNWTKDPSKLEQLGYSEGGISQMPLAPGSKAALRSPQTRADTARDRDPEGES